MKEDPESQCKLEALLPGTGASLGKPADICKYMLRKKVEIKFFFFFKKWCNFKMGNIYRTLYVWNRFNKAAVWFKNKTVCSISSQGRNDLSFMPDILLLL